MRNRKKKTAKYYHMVKLMISEGNSNLIKLLVQIDFSGV